MAVFGQQASLRLDPSGRLFREADGSPSVHATGHGDLCDALAAYAREHHDCNVPKDWSENQKLARWVRRQRHYLRFGSLRPDRRARLEALGLSRGALYRRMEKYGV